MMKKIVVVLLIIALLGGVYAYFFMYNKSHPDYEKLDADMKITAEKLFTDCKNNGNASLYTGKILEITGKPTSLEKNDTIYTLVFAFEEGMFGDEGIRASFLPNYFDQLNTLNLKDVVVLKAFCAGYNDTDVILEKASIVKK